MDILCNWLVGTLPLYTLRDTIIPLELIMALHPSQVIQLDRQPRLPPKTKNGILVV